MKQPNRWPPRGRFSSPSFAPLFAAFLTAAALLASCSQSPLFFDISKEVAPKNPIIQGSPTKMVASAVTGSNRLYVANGSIWSYDGTSWTRAAQPSGTVRDLAATTTALYALTVDGTGSTTTRLWKTTDGTAWNPVANTTGYDFIDSIYGANAELFAGAHMASTGTYGIFYDNADTLASVKTDLGSGGVLVGAVWDGTNYYVATSSLGIFYGTGAMAISASAIGGTVPSGYSLNGLIALTGQIAAVGRHNTNGGYLIAGTLTGFSTYISGNSYKFNGALATYGSNQLLLLGGTSGTYTNGYMEIVLSAGKLSASPSLQSPGNGSPTTVGDSAKYAASLGKKMVNWLCQSPLSDGTLFAATNLYGLWAYRNSEWNAQD